MSDLRRLVDSILVPHTLFQQGQMRMGQCMEYAKAGAFEPVCLALVGESRTGKSRGLEVFMRAHQKIRFAEGMSVPVLMIRTPSRPTVISIAERGLQSLGAIDWERGQESSKTAKLAYLMKACGVMVLILDEFHHFYDKASERVQHHVADWLKNLVSDTNVALVVSGLQSLRAVIDQNEQLAGRFMSPVLMPRFDWLNPNHREEWQAILGAFTEGIRTRFDLPDLDEEELALRMFCATGGLIGYLSKTLRQAVWDAIDAKRKTISLEDLAAAHAAAVWADQDGLDMARPFDRSWTPDPTPDLVIRAHRVGVAKAPPVSKQSRRGLRVPTPSVSSALAAR